MIVLSICSLQMEDGERKENTYSLFSVYEGHIFHKGAIYNPLLRTVELLEVFQ